MILLQERMFLSIRRYLRGGLLMGISACLLFPLRTEAGWYTQTSTDLDIFLPDELSIKNPGINFGATLPGNHMWVNWRTGCWAPRETTAAPKEYLAADLKKVKVTSSPSCIEGTVVICTVRGTGVQGKESVSWQFTAASSRGRCGAQVLVTGADAEFAARADLLKLIAEGFAPAGKGPKPVPTPVPTPVAVASAPGATIAPARAGAAVTPLPTLPPSPASPGTPKHLPSPSRQAQQRPFDPREPGAAACIEFEQARTGLPSAVSYRTARTFDTRGNAVTSIRTEIVQNLEGRPVERKSSASRTTWDVFGNRLAVFSVDKTGAEKLTHETTYDAFGRALVDIDHAGQKKKERSYDAMGNISTEAQHEHGVLRRLEKRVVDAGGNVVDVTTTLYNSDGTVYSVLRETFRNFYDGRGDLVRVESTDGKRQFSKLITRDGAGRPIFQIQWRRDGTSGVWIPGMEWEWSYDTQGHVTRERVEGVETRRSYNDSGRLVREEYWSRGGSHPDSADTFAYDSVGNRISKTPDDARGPRTTYDYSCFASR